MRSALTVAGSDSIGGAGIQADVKAMAVVGIHATSVITAVTAQNTQGVDDIFPMPAEFIQAQLESVLRDCDVKAVKTGMLYSAEIVETVADILEDHEMPLIVDPVMVSGTGDVWNVIKTAAPTGWVVDDALNIDPMREEYLDLAKKLKDNDYMNDATQWQEAWFADMKAESKVFGFYGPAWLINYTLGQNCGEGESSSKGDWAVCAPNVGFYWGGTYLLAGKGAAADPVKAEFVKGFIEWVTLDTSDTGLQYMWANGLMNENGTKDTVASNVVLAKSNGEVEFLGGQNMFEYFIPANEYAKATNMTQYDSIINDAWGAAVGQYAAGEVDRDTAIENFKADLGGKLDIEID